MSATNITVTINRVHLICKNIASITYYREKGNIAPYKEKGPFKKNSDQ